MKFGQSKWIRKIKSQRVSPVIAWLFLLSLILPFQNCSLNLNSVSSTLNALKFESGNGGGYEGKLTVALTYKNEIKYTDKLEMNSGEWITYQIEGGVPPYQLELKGQGTLDIENKRYTAPYFKESPITEILTITDGAGTKAEIQLIVYSFIGSSRIYYPVPGSPTDTYSRPILVDSKGTLYNFNLFFDYQQNFRFELRKSSDHGSHWTPTYEGMYFSTLEKPCDSFIDIKNKFSFIVDDFDHLYALYEFKPRINGVCNLTTEIKKIVLKSSDGGVNWEELPSDKVPQSIKQLQSKSFYEILDPANFPNAGISKTFSIQDKIAFANTPDTAITNLGGGLRIRISEQRQSLNINSMRIAALIEKSTDEGQSWSTLDRHTSISQLGGIFAARDYVDLGNGKIMVVGFGTDKSASPGWDDQYWTRWVTYLSNDGGESWSLSDMYVLPQGYHSNAEKVFANSRGEIFVMGYASYNFSNQVWTIRKSSDSGKTWNTVDTLESTNNYTLTAQPQKMIEFSDKSLLVAGLLSSSGSTSQPMDLVLKRSVNWGSSWQSLSKRPEYFIKMIKCFNTETVYLLTSKNSPVKDHPGQYESLYHLYSSEDKGNIWTETAIGSIEASLTGDIADMICDENKLYLFSNNWLNYTIDSKGTRILVEDPEHVNSVLTMDKTSGQWSKKSFTTNSRFVINSVSLINNMFWFAGTEVYSFQSIFPYKKEQEWRVVKSNLSFSKIFVLDNRKTDIDPGLETDFRSLLPSEAFQISKCNSVRIENQPSDMDSICVMGIKSMGATLSDRNIYSTLRVLRTPTKGE